LLPIYRYRAERLGSKPSDHAARLRGEVQELCDALERNIERNVALFHVAAPDGRSFYYFECVETGQVLGALLSYDARVISDDEYMRIWGTRRPAWPG
jgi:hypothetical protein